MDYCFIYHHCESCSAVQLLHTITAERGELNQWHILIYTQSNINMYIKYKIMYILRNTHNRRIDTLKMGSGKIERNGNICVYIAKQMKHVSVLWEGPTDSNRSFVNKWISQFVWVTWHWHLSTLLSYFSLKCFRFCCSLPLITMDLTLASRVFNICLENVCACACTQLDLST